MKKDSDHIRGSIAHEEKLEADFKIVGLASYFATSEDSRMQMALQEKTGFAQRILKNSVEDIWNDL